MRRGVVRITVCAHPSQLLSKEPASPLSATYTNTTTHTHTHPQGHEHTDVKSACSDYSAHTHVRMLETQRSENLG